jgi:hypothetical protein
MSDPHSTCSCKNSAEAGTPGRANRSVPWDRLAAARAAAEAELVKRLGTDKPVIQNGEAQIFDSGFSVATGGGTKSAAYISFAGVRNHIPYAFVLSYDLSILQGAKTQDGYADVMLVELAIQSPVAVSVRIPLQAQGVLRDPDSGAVVRISNFEFVPALAGDGAEALKLALCILGCVGAACGWTCWAPCMAGPAACIACVLACATAEGEAIMACIEACHLATS